MLLMVALSLRSGRENGESEEILGPVPARYPILELFQVAQYSVPSASTRWMGGHGWVDETLARGPQGLV